MKTLGCVRCGVCVCICIYVCACEIVRECAFFGCCYFFCQFFPFIFGCRIQFAFCLVFFFFFGRFLFSFFFLSFLYLNSLFVCAMNSAATMPLQIFTHSSYAYSYSCLPILPIACTVQAAVCAFYSSWLLFLLFSIYVQFKSFLFLLHLISLLASTANRGEGENYATWLFLARSAEKKQIYKFFQWRCWAVIDEEILVPCSNANV